MPKPWLKLWNCARNDAKLRCLSDQHFRIWFNLLCLANEQSEEGVIRLPARILAAEVCNDVTESLQIACNELSALGLIEYTLEEAQNILLIVFTKFKKRQERYPSASPDRVRERVTRHRENKGCVDFQKVVQPVKTNVTTCNESVTCKNASEEEEEEDIKKEKSSKKKEPKSPGFSLPDWVPAEDWADFVEMRKSIKKPMTDRAKVLRLGDLSKLRDAGQDPSLVLRQSVASCYQDLYPLKANDPISVPISAARQKEPPLPYLDSPMDSPWRQHAEKLSATRESLFQFTSGQDPSGQPRSRAVGSGELPPEQRGD